MLKPGKLIVAANKLLRAFRTYPSSAFKQFGVRMAKKAIQLAIANPEEANEALGHAKQCYDKCIALNRIN